MPGERSRVGAFFATARPTSMQRNRIKRVTIQTLWKTAFEQCELVFLGLSGCRLRLWVKGALVIDEDVFDLTAATRRAAELKAEWPVVIG